MKKFLLFFFLLLCYQAEKVHAQLFGGQLKSTPSSFPPGHVNCNPKFRTAVVEVTSLTGRIWMDRNLGAEQVATSPTDSKAFGDLYQWGRWADGHQCRTSGTTSTLSNTDRPPHDDFIRVIPLY